MLLSSILLPFLTLLTPFQHPALDDLRTTRLGPRALAVYHNQRVTLSGIVLASAVIGHHLFRAETCGYPLDPNDALASRPPAHVEEVLCRAYKSSLLRNTCGVQKIPAPLPLTCINKAVNPSFEYAPKSPAPPAFPVHRQVCSLKATPVFADADMSLLYPPTSPNTLVFPEPAYSSTMSARSLDSSFVAVVGASVIELASFLAMLAPLTMIWVGLVVIVVFRPSVYDPMADLTREVEGVELDLVISTPGSENGKGVLANCLDQMLAKECQFEELFEEIIPRPPFPSLLPVLPELSSAIVEPPTPHAVCLGLLVESLVEPPILLAHSESNPNMPEIINAAAAELMSAPPSDAGSSFCLLHSATDAPISEPAPSPLQGPERRPFHRYSHVPWQDLLRSQEQDKKFARARQSFRPPPTQTTRPRPLMVL